MTGRATLKVLVVLATLLGVVLTVAWFGFLAPSYLSYRNPRFEAVHDIVEPGTDLQLRVERCNTSGEDEVYLITHTLYRLDPPAGDADAARPRILPAGAAQVSPGCNPEISRANHIPPDTEDGLYFVKGFARVDAGWRIVKVPWSSAPFRVRRPVPASAPVP